MLIIAEVIISTWLNYPIRRNLINLHNERRLIRNNRVKIGRSNKYSASYRKWTVMSKTRRPKILKMDALRNWTVLKSSCQWLKDHRIKKTKLDGPSIPKWTVAKIYISLLQKSRDCEITFLDIIKNNLIK